MNQFDYSKIRGFNYQPSYAWNLYEVWKFFDEAVFDKEIGRGKKYFPKMNTIRIWLSYDAFHYEEDRQSANFETALAICHKYDCKVIPVLFNCWHDAVMDAGGTYHPQMIPESIWSAKESMYDSYIEKIVRPHATDERILMWDVCNEPYTFGTNTQFQEMMEPYETAWLRKISLMCKEAGIKQPLGISLADHVNGLPRIADFIDVFMIHPYYFLSDADLELKDDEGFDKLLKDAVELAGTYGKPVVSTETCWGSKSSMIRAEIVKRTLEAHQRVGIGYVVHALNYSHIPDLHDECDGPVGAPGNLAFVNKDGHIREGHEIFNQLS